MDLAAQHLAHLPAADVCDGVEGKAVEQLIVVQQILPDAVEDEVHELVLFV